MDFLTKKTTCCRSVCAEFRCSNQYWYSFSQDGRSVEELKQGARTFANTAALWLAEVSEWTAESNRTSKQAA